MAIEKRKKRWIAFCSVLLAASCVTVSLLLFQGRLPLRTIACAGRIKYLRFSPDGNILGTVIEGQGIILWNARRWTSVQVLPGFFNQFYFLSDGRSLLTFRLHGGPGAEAVNREGGLTASEWNRLKIHTQGQMQIWDIQSGRILATYTMPVSTDLDVAPKTHLAVFVRRVAPIGLSVLNTENGHEVYFIPGLESLSAAFSPDGNWLCVFNPMTDSDLTLWDTHTWHKKILIVSGRVADACFSPNSRLLGAATAQAIRLWSVGDWRQSSPIATDYQQINRLCFSQDSQQIVAGGIWPEPPQQPFHTGLTIWNVATGFKTVVLDNQEEVFWQVTSRGILTHDLEDHSKNVLWDSHTGQRLWQGQATYWPEAAISPDGRTLVTTRFDGSHPSEEQGVRGFMEIRHLPSN